MLSFHATNSFPRNIKLAAAACLTALVIALAGCGQKGPLFLPDDDAKNKKKAAHATEPSERRPV